MRRTFDTRFARTLLFALAALTAITTSAAPSRADDGYDTPFAQAVRAATESDRLLLWATSDGYVQSTNYVASVGTMYTNHARFDPPDLAHPTVLIFDQAGRAVACEYQFTKGTPPPSAFSSVPAGAWFDIARHVHYNIRVDGKDYYAQAEWPTEETPTADALVARKLMPKDAQLEFAFVHPATRAVIVWAWLPNEDGLFAGDNASMP